jgi:precorrin-6B C5,15-methyltransferase / cobalt-precorrin-6B C5,C15-methyltransferase
VEGSPVGHTRTVIGADAVPVLVVGIGEDGWDGLPPAAARALRDADVVLGSPRQLELVSAHVSTIETWPSPMTDALPGLLDRYAGRRLAVLASGDPMLHGVGASLIRRFGPAAVRVLPGPSSVSTACARLGWPVAEVDVVSLVTQPYEVVRRYLQPARRLILLVAEASAAARLAADLTARGWGSSRLTVLERLGGPDERISSGAAAEWSGTHHPLTVLAVSLVPGASARVLPTVPGLPDDAFSSDGALTKREVRAVTLAALAPSSGQLLWDVGAGSGSIAVEWMRTSPGCRAAAIEPRDDRCATIRANALELGVPGLDVVEGSAPAALAGLPRPDAIFVGGGLTTPGLLDACLAALDPGARLVANAVTLESEAELVRRYTSLGGSLVRLDIARAAPVGSFTSFRPALPVTQWTYVRERP